MSRDKKIIMQVMWQSKKCEQMTSRAGRCVSALWNECKKEVSKIDIKTDNLICLELWDIYSL